MKNKIIRFFPLLVLCLIYIANVFPGILKGYTAFTYDNGRDMLVTFRLLYEKKLTLIGPTTGIDGVFHGAWWYYFLIIPFLIFQGNPQGIVFTIASFGLFGMIILHFLLKKITNGWIAFFGGLIYVTSPEILGRFSQIGHNDLEVFLGAVSLLFLYQYIKNEKKQNIFLGLFGLSSAFIFEFEFAYGMFVFAFSMLFFLLFLGRSLKKYLWFFGFALIPLIPRILFELKHGFLMTKTLINYFLHPTTKMYSGGLIDRFYNRINVFSGFWKDLLQPSLIMVSVFLFILTVIFLPKLIKTKNLSLKTIGLFSYFVSFFIFICFLYYKDVIWGNYLNGIMIYFVFVASVSLFFLQKTSKAGKLVTFFIIFILLFNSALNIFNSFKKADWKGEYSVMRNQRKVMEYIKSDVASLKYGLGVYSATGFSYPYDYWYLWEEKFRNIPRPTSLWKSKINYLIIEPDDRKILVDKWMETNMHKNARLIGRQRIVDVVVEKWRLD